MWVVVTVSFFGLVGACLWVLQQRSYVARDTRSHPSTTLSDGAGDRASDNDLGRDRRRPTAEATR